MPWRRVARDAGAPVRVAFTAVGRCAKLETGNTRSRDKRHKKLLENRVLQPAYPPPRNYSVSTATACVEMKLYEPIDVPKSIDRDIWLVDGPIVRLKRAVGSIPFPTRAVVVRLAGGGLWIWSPTELSQELRANLAPLGPVHHLVSPNKIHYAHVAAWKAAYP